MRIDRVIEMVTMVTKWLTYISSISIAIMLLINIIEVLGTKLFNWSLIGYLELTEQLMVAVSLLPIAYIAMERGHIRITMVADRLPSIGRYVFEIIGYILGILIMAFCAWRACAQMQYALNTKLATNVLSIPIWPTNLIIMIGFGLLFFSWLLLLVKKITLSAHT